MHTVILLSQLDGDPLRVNDIICVHFGFKKSNSYPINFDADEKEEALLFAKL